MAIVADSGGIFGLYDRRDAAHRRIRAVVERERDRIIIPCPVLGEIDYLLRVRLGSGALIQFLTDIDRGAFFVEMFTPEDLHRCSFLLEKYSDVDLGLCDAAVVAVAERLNTNRILTVDRRDFRSIRSIHGKSFRLLPGDRL
jgi:predicted nucleic acid-binding protein